MDQLIQLHDKADLQEEKMRIAVSLGSVRKEEVIKKVLKFAISVNKNSNFCMMKILNRIINFKAIRKITRFCYCYMRS